MDERSDKRYDYFSDRYDLTDERRKVLPDLDKAMSNVVERVAQRVNKNCSPKVFRVCMTEFVDIEKKLFFRSFNNNPDVLNWLCKSMDEFNNMVVSQYNEFSSSKK